MWYSNVPIGEWSILQQKSSERTSDHGHALYSPLQYMPREFDKMSMKEFKTGRYENRNADNGVPEFWQAERVYHTVTFIFGKIGSRGTRASRDFSSSSEAQNFLETRLKEKIAEGFVRVD